MPSLNNYCKTSHHLPQVGTHGLRALACCVPVYLAKQHIYLFLLHPKPCLRDWSDIRADIAQLCLTHRRQTQLCLSAGVQRSWASSISMCPSLCPRVSPGVLSAGREKRWGSALCPVFVVLWRLCISARMSVFRVWGVSAISLLEFC